MQPHLPTWFYRRARRARTVARTLRECMGFLAEHATKAFTGPPPNWVVLSIFALLCSLIVSVLGNIVFLSLFLLAAYG